MPDGRMLSSVNGFKEQDGRRCVPDLSGAELVSFLAKVFGLLWELLATRLLSS